MAAVVWKEIKPKRLNQRAMFNELLKGMNQVGKEMKQEYQKTTRTWKNKPEFEIVKDTNPNGPEVLVGTDSLIYKFLDEGTSIRYATMTPDFVSKTVPRMLSSRRGKGGLAYVDTRRPRPGIEAREFSTLIQKKYQPRFKRRMEQAMRDARKRSGHAI